MKLSHLKSCAAFAAFTLAGASYAQSTWATSITGVNNNSYIDALSYVSTNGSPAIAQMNQSFTGLDRAGNTQTMTLQGLCNSSSSYGAMHIYSAGSVTNSYYNDANSVYCDHDGNLVDPNGSPSTLSVLGFAAFSDTLQFGGALQDGYKARYVFSIDGLNTAGGASDMSVKVDGGESDFFDFNAGPLNTIWATDEFAVNGTTPQSLDVTFSDQVVFDMYNLDDGTTISGVSDFNSTARLLGIEIVDANGDLVKGVTVSSGSGTQYRILETNPVPEPTSLSILFIGLGGLVARKRRAQR